MTPFLISRLIKNTIYIYFYISWIKEIFPSATAIVDMFEIYPDDDDSVMFPVDNMLNNVKITVIGADSVDDIDVESPFGNNSSILN